MLWIGTSAGVVLTLSVSAKAAPTLVGLSQGHTGHVRFLTAIELPDGFDLLFPLPRDTGRWGGCRGPLVARLRSQAWHLWGWECWSGGPGVALKCWSVLSILAVLKSRVKNWQGRVGETGC